VLVGGERVGPAPGHPFGGEEAAVDEFTELKWVTAQSGTRPFPF